MEPKKWTHQEASSPLVGACIVGRLELQEVDSRVGRHDGDWTSMFEVSRHLSRCARKLWARPTVERVASRACTIDTGSDSCVQDEVVSIRLPIVLSFDHTRYSLLSGTIWKLSPDIRVMVTSVHAPVVSFVHEAMAVWPAVTCVGV